MILDINFPILVRAIPKGARLTRDVYVNQVRSAVVPEIDGAETSTVFSCRDDRGSFRIREHGGRYYRAALMKDRTLARALASPFTRNEYERCTETLPSVSGVRAEIPVAASVMNHYRWWMDAFSGKGLRETNVWPAAYPERQRWTDDFDAILATLRDVHVPDIDLSDAMVERQAGKLLLIDGELHIETERPVYLVGRLFSGAQHNAVGVQLVLEPDSYDGDVLHSYFPLDRKDEAVERAVLLAERNFLHGLSTWAERLPEIECDDPGIFTWDNDLDDARKLAMTVTQGCRRFLEMNDGPAQEVSEAEWATLDLAVAEMAKTNLVLGTMGEPERHLDALMPLWSRLKRPHYAVGFGEDKKGLVDFYLDRAASASISITEVGPSAVGFRP